MKKTYNINICDLESWIFIENKMFNQTSQWINILVIYLKNNAAPFYETKGTFSKLNNSQSLLK